MAAPTLAWLRRDLRRADNPALAAAAAEGPAIPPCGRRDARAARARRGLDKSLRALAAAPEAKGSRLAVRRGTTAEVVRALAEETGARALAAIKPGA
jgi:deoxyribodipyrimidine photo-lyase